MPNPIVHFEIMGSDTAKTQEFYSSLFGWTISSDNPAGYGLALTQDEGGLGINGGIGGADQGGGVRVSVYAQVDDPQAYLDKAVAGRDGDCPRDGSAGNANRHRHVR